MAKLPVFISHSTDHASAADVERLRAIVAALGAGPDGFDVMWDGGEIKGADDWYERIDMMLAECRAAIILFSERALTQSQWVLKEATILSHRMARDKGFRVLPVLMPGATESRLTQGAWEPLRYSCVQYQRKNDGDIDDLVARARAAIDPTLATRTPLDELATAIAASLEHAPITGLQSACDALLERADWIGAPSVRQGFSMALARRLLRTRTVTDAVTILDAVPGLSPEAASAIYNIVSALWVDPQAAAPLQAGVLHDAGRVGVALNGKRVDRFTAFTYVRRAYPGSSLPTFSKITNANAGDIVEHIITSLRRDTRIARPQLADLDDDDVDAYLNNPAVLHFVLVPTMLSDKELTRLRTVYSHPTFIFSTGPTLPTVAAPAGVRYLQPELDLARETQAFQDWLVATTNVSNRIAARGGGG